MKLHKNIATIAAMLPLYLGCAQQQLTAEKQHVETRSEIKPDEDRAPFVYDSLKDKHLQTTLFGNLGNDIQGRLLLYDDGKRELDITSKLGRLHAIDFNNDCKYDTIEGSGDLQKYSNNSFLNQAAEEILSQNR